jgi:hypothetical protein
VKAAWVDLGCACAVTDAALGTADEAEAQRVQAIAGGRMDAAIDALCATPAHSIAGLVTKARVTSIDNGEMFDDLRRSIVDDLLAIDAGAARA